MSMFIVKHQHQAEKCPAKDPKMGAMLLKHIDKKNAASMGVTIKADGVVDGAHTFYLIVDAPSSDKVKQFMTPFSMAGSVDIMPASSCEQVVGRAAC